MGQHTRVLIADDDPDIASGMSRVFARISSAVSVVTDLDLLSPALDTHRPDVLLLDLMWREHSVLSRMVDMLRRHQELRVCMYTNYSAPRLVYDAFRAGAVGYLLEPAILPEIEEAMETMAAGRRYLSAELRIIPGIDESIASGVPPVVPLTKDVRGTPEWDRSVAWLQYDLRTSPREAEIMLLARQGLTKGEASIVLGCREHTVASHCVDLYAKFKGHGVRNAASLGSLTSESLGRRPRDWVRQELPPKGGRW